eukprot:TRINITY_DN34466_c0_g1_i1.p1 TRINITY_DN34466_c0_g1~~TRINITY_DN34466_c0_g1_i1.p1  ORF type:complete len:1534 (+),score=217.20 TRINITY_DN34466_c0_g1_i1:151-4752(+)
MRVGAAASLASGSANAGTTTHNSFLLFVLLGLICFNVGGVSGDGLKKIRDEVLQRDQFRRSQRRFRYRDKAHTTFDNFGRRVSLKRNIGDEVTSEIAIDAKGVHNRNVDNTPDEADGGLDDIAVSAEIRSDGAFATEKRPVAKSVHADVPTWPTTLGKSALQSAVISPSSESNRASVIRREESHIVFNESAGRVGSLAWFLGWRPSRRNAAVWSDSLEHRKGRGLGSRFVFGGGANNGNARGGEESFDSSAVMLSTGPVDGTASQRKDSRRDDRPPTNDEDSLISCDPRKMSADEYEKCEATREDEPECDMEKCPRGCCCLSPTIFRWIRKGGTHFKVMVIHFFNTVEALEDSFQGRTQVEASGMAEAQLVEERNKFLLAVFLDLQIWFFVMPTISLLLVSIHGCISRGKGMDTKKADTELAEGELNVHLTKTEQERLGGIEKFIIVRMSGLSTLRWMLTNSFGLGLYHAVMANPVTLTICALGRSGRLLVVTKKPILDSKAGSSRFLTVGAIVMFFTLLSVPWFHAVERSLKILRRSSNPELQKAAANPSVLQKLCDGHAWFPTLFVLILQWGVWLVVLKVQNRPWGTNDDRNFYESKEACLAQYYRTGTRGIIPCISPRRRRGGMRIFFGPYPDHDVFNIMAKDDCVLRSLEPLAILPHTADDGFPPSDTQSAGQNNRVEWLQWIVGLINVLIGAIGLAIFYIHIHNFIVNLGNCPHGAPMTQCLTSGNCEAVAKTPWFEYYLLSNDLRSADQVSRARLAYPLDIGTIGSWLKTDTDEVTRAKMIEIANQACSWREEEYILGENATYHGPKIDTIARFNARNYLQVLDQLNVSIAWDNETLSCTSCPKAIFLHYFSDFENLMEILEIGILVCAFYLQTVIYDLLSSKITNCPMVDVSFETDPALSESTSVEEVESSCLSMIGKCFFFKYTFSGVPKHVELLEKRLRNEQENTDSAAAPDPWKEDNTCKTWSSYSIHEKLNRRMMLISRPCLGILEGEEIVGAWSEAPALSTNSKILIFLGFFTMVALPFCYWRYIKHVGCLAEAFFLTACWMKSVEYFVIRRRPQAGFVLTSRRLFQITRQPAYQDLFGMTEPTIKIDIIVHNSEVNFSMMTMESFVPLLRRLSLKCMNRDPYRRGQVLCQGLKGIFRIQRSMGETSHMCATLSRIALTMKLQELTPQMGARFKEQEDQEAETVKRSRHVKDDIPDPPCAWCCCPQSPALQGMGDKPVLDRYCERKKGEADVYLRNFAIRPATCVELCCGRGCNCELSCCCCCQLDECRNEFCVSNHRIVIEHRASQRYCRLCMWCRLPPVVRMTFIAHYQTAAYLVMKPVQPFGISKVKQDLCVKLLAEGHKQYQAGLTLHQRPYIIGDEKQAKSDKAWLLSITTLYDCITGFKTDIGGSSRSESSASGSESDPSQSGDSGSGHARDHRHGHERAQSSEKGGRSSRGGRGRGRGDLAAGKSHAGKTAVSKGERRGGVTSKGRPQNKQPGSKVGVSGGPAANVQAHSPQVVGQTAGEESLRGALGFHSAET